MNYQSHFLRYILVVILILVAIPGLTGCTPKMEQITIGAPSLEQNALLYVAAAQEYFETEGLQVTFKDYETGVGTLSALVNGEVDIACSAEYPFVSLAFQQKPVKIIAADDKFENDYLVARKDRNISGAADLKGKKSV